MLIRGNVYIIIIEKTFNTENISHIFYSRHVETAASHKCSERKEVKEPQFSKRMVD